MSTAKIVDGRKPLAARKKTLNPKNADAFGNKFTLSEELKKELKEQGLVGRFINYKQLTEMGGVHAKDWRPYKRKSSDTMDTASFLSGTDPNGYVRRGDSILAVKSEEEVEAHREWLQARAARHKNFKKQKADELREYARDHGIKTRIDEDDEFEDAEQET